MAASNTRFTQNSLGQSKNPIDSDHGIYRYRRNFILIDSFADQGSSWSECSWHEAADLRCPLIKRKAFARSEPFGLDPTKLSASVRRTWTPLFP